MKKFFLGVSLFLSASLALAQMPEKTRQEVAQAIQQGNYEQAVRLLRPWAWRGDARAQHSLGVMYRDGLGVAQDYAQAREWLEKAAAQGNAKAQYCLGAMYYDGHGGIARNYVKALEWWEKAADQGNARAQFNIGVIYRDGQGVAQDDGKAREWFEKAAAQTENAEVVRKARQALERMRGKR